MSSQWRRLSRRNSPQRRERQFEVWFFFSSRRRHTRFDCDWSSDVCSSDLRRMKPGISPSSCARPAKRCCRSPTPARSSRSEEHTSELQSQSNLVCRLLLEKKKYHPRAPPPAKQLLLTPVRLTSPSHPPPPT